MISFGRGGKSIAASFSNGEIRIWPDISKDQFQTIDAVSADSFTDRVRSLEFSADGLRLAYGSDKELGVWDTAVGDQIVTLDLDVAEVVFTTNDRYLARKVSYGAE